MATKIEKANLVLGIVGTLVGISGLIIASATYFGWVPITTLTKESDRFYCALQTDLGGKGKVWTVMYRHNKGVKPWLKIVSSLGELSPENRCREVAKRLDQYRKDGLTKLTYQPDPNVPKQYIICAKTKINASSCPVLLTLKPGSDPYLTIRQMADALIPASLTTVEPQSSDGDNSFLNKDSDSNNLSVDLATHLRIQDK